MKILKNISKYLVTVFMLCVIVTTSVSAAEADLPENVATNVENEGQLSIRYVTPEEMDAIIARDEAGISTFANLFSDNILLTLSKNSDGSAKVVFYKQGMIFDGCTLSGTVKLHNSTGVCAQKVILETGFRSGTSRVHTMYPMGGYFSYASFALTVSDGGESATYTGIKYP